MEYSFGAYSVDTGGVGGPVAASQWNGLVSGLGGGHEATVAQALHTGKSFSPNGRGKQ